MARVTPTYIGLLVTPTYIGRASCHPYIYRAGFLSGTVVPVYIFKEQWPNEFGVNVSMGIRT
jgi:hypothetical protein